jgi:prephenate dehydrogenase
MTDLKNITYGIVGLGIMGGSIAKALRTNLLDEPGASGKILACDISRTPLDMALGSGIIDGEYMADQADAMLSQCDLVYVCLYPAATLLFLQTHKAAFKSGSVITDISGVKTGIAENIRSALRSDIDFVIGHPMAGGAKEGYINSSGSCFQGRNYILMPQSYNKSESIELIKMLVTAMGFTRIVETDYKSHDHKIAFTSQLCHVIASALVESAEDDRITEFGGGSFEDLTRIAMINAPLWTELFLSNKKELLAHITEFEKQLDIIRTDIENDNAGHLEKLLEDVRSRRMKMGISITKDDVQ